MSNKIEVLNIEEDTKVNKEKPLEAYSIQELIDLDWKEYLRIANYNKDHYKMCEDCIAEQKRKYNGRTPIVCNGLKDYRTALSHKYSDEVLDTIEKEMTEEELLEIKGVYSAPEWFKANVKDVRTYSPRFHQDLVLKCSAKHKVIRMGRRCIVGTELVSLADGKSIPIKDIEVGDEVLTTNHSLELVSGYVTDKVCNGLSDNVYEVRTKGGSKILLTGNHPLKVNKRVSTNVFKWLSIEDGLEVGDTVFREEKGKVKVDTITSITKMLGTYEVYDIEVYGYHNYITNGLVVHNCGKTFSVILDIIYRIETTDRPLNILVSAPLLTMINEIERTLITLVNATDKNDFIVSKKSSPALEVKFFNGSVLQGITLSNDGTSARGKKADLLWVDEMDFVNRKALEALQAIEMDNPNVEVIYTSTPIGQGNLYQAEQLENTKSFHFPSYVIPHYSDAMHSSMKASLSDIAFAQETIGLYGLDEAGVFQVHYIEDGIDLHIPQVFNQNTVLMNRSRFIVFIGVDWNHDLNGTRIVVTTYDKNTDRFFVVEKEKIAKQNLTQAIAVNLVVDLNRKYNADHIICDEGYGIGQVTELRTRGREQYGKVPANHPDIKLVDTMSVQFGSSLTIRDPSTHQELKKNTKQYIVENAQKLLEEKRLTFNDIDDNELIMQMKNYTQIQAEGGRVKYKAKDKKIGDHDLDAFMLCLYGFDYHYGEYIKPRLVEHGALLNAQGIQYDVLKASETASLVASLGRKGSGFIGGKKPFKMRKRW